MRVMVVDGGGRGQALASKLVSENHEVFVSPGNPGNEEFAYSTGVAPTDIIGQLAAVKRHGIDFTVVGADDPLALGMVDRFHEEGQAIFGPTQEQARIESDRDFAKQLSRQESIPTGPYRIFIDKKAALAYADTRSWPLFVKDNQLAQGKGATKCNNLHELERTIAPLSKIVVEDYVTGPEASLHSFCDGETELTIPFLLRDHKPVGDGDTGPMTGGMGTVGPLPEYDMSEVRKLGEQFAEPGVRRLGFQGLLFAGLKGFKGEEQNLEYNARFGDPETQVFMKLMRSGLLPLLIACSEKGGLAQLPAPEWRTGRSSACLVLAAEGYPADPSRGAVIEGIEDASKVCGVKILHAGTARKDSHIVTNGGRVLNIVSVADRLPQALRQAYAAAEQIAFAGKPPVMRRDIGCSVLEESDC